VRIPVSAVLLIYLVVQVQHRHIRNHVRTDLTVITTKMNFSSNHAAAIHALELS
jgi:hypothetical protein